ncbi:MAG TPA: hypothetical protein PLY87_01490 [Planctomycetaceae bacterium]|nr:hypothetical protein [Planctomycetaceae bacterium]
MVSQSPTTLCFSVARQKERLLLVSLAGFVYPNYRGDRILTWAPQVGATQYDIWINYLSAGQPPLRIAR